MLIKEIIREQEITREYKIPITNLLTNFSPFIPLEIIDENLSNKLELRGRVDKVKKPKLLIALIIRAIWDRVEKIDERFISMYRNPSLGERYPKVAEPKNIIEKIKNAKKYSSEHPQQEKDYLERWLNYLRGRQKVMETMLMVAFSYKSLGRALEDLEEEARLKM